MKSIKSSLIFCIFMCLFHISTITYVKAQEIAIGVKAGANFVKLTDLPAGFPSSKMALGAHIGPFIKVPINENFSFQPELLFSIKGNYINETFFGFNLEIITGLSYIDLPLMFNYQLESGLNFEAGPYIGFLVMARSKVSAMGFSETEDISEFTNKVDVGAGLGIGYRLEKGLGFGARYNLGFIPVFKESEFIETDVLGNPILDSNGNLIVVKQDAYGKNSNFMISVSWLFGQN
ncbi:MAG: porin family protein [Bacteroidia bacterium]